MKKHHRHPAFLRKSPPSQLPLDDDIPVLTDEDEDHSKSGKPFLGHIRFGISMIDSNPDLKAFIAKQEERKQLYRNRLEKDIKIYIDDLKFRKKQQN